MTAGAGLEQADIVAALAPMPVEAEEWRWLTGAAPELERQLRAAMPPRSVSAAVLVPLVTHDAGYSVLLTQRSTELKDHAGQISFPGGRIEASDADPWQAALREAQEEIGLDRDRVSFGGYLPVHPILTGYRVTPVVGFVLPGYRLALDAAEVDDAFEVPLDYVFDIKNYRPRQRTLGGAVLQTTEIHYAGHIIWGATCGMLMTLRRLVMENRIVRE